MISNDRRILVFFAAMAVAVIALVAIDARAQSPAKPSITGSWLLNKEKSDQPPERGERGQRGDRQGGAGGRGGYGRRGGGGGGGFRGGVGGGGGAGRGGGMNPEDMARMRDAMRDITNPADHLTIVETESMVIVTAGDGRTTRLSVDGKKIKDENTNIERKTKWDGDKLVSEISGLGPGKMTQSYSVDPEGRTLRIVVLVEGGNQPRTITHVFDRE